MSGILIARLNQFLIGCGGRSPLECKLGQILVLLQPGDITLAFVTIGCQFVCREIRPR